MYLIWNTSLKLNLNYWNAFEVSLSRLLRLQRCLWFYFFCPCSAIAWGCWRRATATCCCCWCSSSRSTSWKGESCYSSHGSKMQTSMSKICMSATTCCLLPAPPPSHRQDRQQQHEIAFLIYCTSALKATAAPSFNFSISISISIISSKAATETATATTGDNPRLLPLPEWAPFRCRWP